MKNRTHTRRKFIELTTLTTAGFLISPVIFAESGKKPVFRFGMLSDIHYAERDVEGTRFYRQSLAKVKEFTDVMNKVKVNFVIELGDFKDQDPVPDEIKTLKYLTDIESVFRQFNGPTYHVLGNHDMDGISKEQFLNRVLNTAVPASRSYYSFNQNDFHFIVLDGNFTKEGKEYDHGNFEWDDAFIPSDQVNWLKEDLKLNQFPVIVFIHQMLDDTKGMSHCVKNAAEIREILEQAGKVLCVFQGHVHEERYSLINHIHYYSLYAVVDNSGVENNSYMIVDLYKDNSIVINGFRRASNQKFTVNE